MSEGLDSYQRGAVEAEGLRIRVLAGAGSGKTRCLAGRVTWLLDEQGVPPEEILALTFSKKAAEELKFRCQGRIDTRTIHSLGYRLLMTLHPGRQVADDRVKKRTLRRVMATLKSQHKFSDLLAALNEWKGKGCVTDTPEKHRAEIVAYERSLHDMKLWDFDDLINVPIRKMRDNPEKRGLFQGKWKHILIDEVQDTDDRQWQLFELLTTPETTLFLVGDISQSIYGWRGAKPMALFGEVEQKLGPFIEYRLPRNYRSRPDVIHVANRVVAGKQGAVHLEPTKDAGPEVFLIQHPDGSEPLQVRDWIKAIGAPWSEIAVLARTNAKLADYEALLGAENIPYAITGGYSFFDRSEVQDVLAYLIAARSLDEGVPNVDALERIYSKPTRFLGKVWLNELHAYGGWLTWKQCRGKMGFSKPYMDKRSQEFYRAIEGLMAAPDAQAAAEYVIDGPIGYRAWVQGEDLDIADELRDENLTSLIEQAEDKSIEDLVALAMECSRRSHEDGDEFQVRDRVTLSTVHKAKGLEWPSVAVVGLDQDVWPHKRAEDPEEERRILYVALTRAEERLLVSSRVPSEFYREVVRHAQDAGVSVSWRGQSPQSPGGGGREPDHAPADASA